MSVLTKYTKLKTESKSGTLVVKFAREAIFGNNVLQRCTVAGGRELPALPVSELGHLKEMLFNQFPSYWTGNKLIHETSNLVTTNILE